MGIPSCRLQLAGDQPLANSIFTQLRWAAPAVYVTNDRIGCPPEVYADVGMFDPADPGHVTITLDGVYRCWVSAKFADKSSSGTLRRTGRRALAIQMNDGGTDILISVPADPGGTTSLPGYIELPLIAGDRISVWLEQQCGTTLNTIGHSAKDTTVGLSWDRPLAT